MSRIPGACTCIWFLFLVGLRLNILEPIKFTMKRLFPLQILFVLAVLFLGCEMKPTYSQCPMYDKLVLDSDTTELVLAGPYAPNCFAYDPDATGSYYPALDYYVRFSANGSTEFAYNRLVVRGITCPAMVVTVLSENCDSIYSQRLYTGSDSITINVQVSPPFTVVFSPNSPDTIIVEWLEGSPQPYTTATACNPAPVSVQNPSVSRHGWAKFPPTAYTAPSDSLYPPLHSGIYVDNKGIKIRVIQSK